MAGLLEFLQSPQGAGLLSGVATYAANARRNTPVNNIGRGLAGGIMGYQGAIEQTKADSETALTQRLKQLQMSQVEQQIANQRSQLDTQKAQQEWKAGLPSVMAPKMTGTTDQGRQLAETQSAFGQDGMQSLTDSAQYAATKERPYVPLGVDYGVDKQAVQQYMMQPGSLYAEKMIEKQLFPESVVVGRTLKNKDTGETLGYDETWKEEQAASREQRINELNMRLQDQRLSREQNAELRRELAAQTAALQRESIAMRRDTLEQGNKPPAGYRYTADGNLEQIPGGPADLKRQAQLEGGGTVDTVVATLRDQFDQLDKGGGITSTNNRAGTNIGAWVSRSSPGQIAGNMFGTKNQSARDSIAQTRPILLQAIMKATGMSAKQMDSNVELKLYLATATDPTLGLEANRRALDMIEKLYGSGTSKETKSLPKSSNALPQKSLTNPNFPGFSIVK